MYTRALSRTVLRRIALSVLMGILSLPTLAQSSVGSGPDLVQPQAMAVEAAGTLVVVDRNLDAVLRIDPVTGDRTVVSDASVGSGPAFRNPTGIAVEAVGTLVVVDSDLHGVLRVDPVSGDRTVVSDASVGNGAAFTIPQAIAVEAAGTLVVVDGFPVAVLRVDPVSGDRAVVSGCTGLSLASCPAGQLVGSGPTFRNPMGIAVEASGTLVVVDSLPAVLRVDPVSGDRTVVSDASVGSGPGFSKPGYSNPTSIAVEAAGTLVVVDGFPAAVLRVDPVSGDRVVVSGCTITRDPCLRRRLVGSGPALSSPTALAVEAAGTLVVADSFPAAILQVDPFSGDRTVISDVRVGSGPALIGGGAIAVEAAGTLVEADFSAVLRVDPVTGDRAVVTGCTVLSVRCPPRRLVGKGRVFRDLAGIAVEATSSIVVVDTFVDDNSPAVLRVDPVSGDRTVVSGCAVTRAPCPPHRRIGNGHDFVFPVAVAVEATGTIVVTDHDLAAVVRVDPVSGDRTVVSGCAVIAHPCPPDQLVGGGPPLIYPGTIAVEATGTLVVWELSREGVLRVDPLSGDRTVVSDANTGSGPAFNGGGAIAVEAAGTLVVADLEAVLRVDPITGDRVVVSGCTIVFPCSRSPGLRVGSGPNFGWLRGIAVEAAGTLVVTDISFGWVLRVDPITGDRTVVSQ